MQKHSWLFEKFSKYILAAILVIVPLFPKFPILGVSGTYVAIRFEDLLLLLLGILVVIKILPNLKTFFKDKIVQAFTIFFLVGFVSLFSAFYLTHTADFKLGFLHLLRRVEYIIPFIAMITLLSKEKVNEYLNFYIKILMVVTIIAFLYGLGQRYLNFPIIITQNEEYSKGVALFWTPGAHINSTFAGHYDEAAVMVLFLTVFITLFTIVKDKLSRFFLILSTFSGLWLLINSLSRIAQISYLSSVGLSLFLVRKFKALTVFFVISLILIGFSSSLETRFARIFEVFYQKINVNHIVGYVGSKFTVLADEVVLPQKRTVVLEAIPIPDPVFEDRSTSIRLNVEWPRAIRAFSKNFILGTGYSSINLATDNDYLRLFGEVGILGFFAFWLIFLRIGLELIKLFPFDKLSGITKAYASSLMGCLLGIFISAFFLDLFEASKFATLFWFLLGMSVYMARSMNYVQKN